MEGTVFKAWACCVPLFLATRYKLAFSPSPQTLSLPFDLAPVDRGWVSATEGTMHISNSTCFGGCLHFSDLDPFCAYTFLTLSFQTQFFNIKKKKKLEKLGLSPFLLILYKTKTCYLWDPFYLKYTHPPQTVNITHPPPVISCWAFVLAKSHHWNPKVGILPVILLLDTLFSIELRF